MADHDPGQARRAGASAESGTEPGSVGTWLHVPGITAAVGAIVGLGLGIIIGRATVSSVPESEPPLALRAATAGGEGVKKDGAKPQKPQPEPEALPEDEDRVLVGRRLPEGKQGSGFERHRFGERPTAKLTQASVLALDLQASSAEYALLAVLGLEGGKGSVVPQLDERPLGSWAIEPGWGIYSAPVPHDALGSSQHQLKLTPTVAGGAVVSVDAVALVPVGSEVSFSMGEESVGHLVEGFANRSGRSVWSLGARSVVGVALAPAAGPYSLTVRGSALPSLAPLKVDCKVNGKDIGSAQFERRGTGSRWAVPANVLRAGANRIEFSYAHTAVPSKLDPKSADNRELALRFTELSLIPQ